MSDQNQATQRQEVNQVAAQWNAAVTDETFRQSLRSDPGGAMKEHFGAEVPQGVKIHVHEQTDDELHIVLPPASDNGELSEQDLQLVSGGFTLIELLVQGRDRPLATKGGI